MAIENLTFSSLEEMDIQIEDEEEMFESCDIEELEEERSHEFTYQTGKQSLIQENSSVKNLRQRKNSDFFKEILKNFNIESNE